MIQQARLGTCGKDYAQVDNHDKALKTVCPADLLHLEAHIE